LNIIWLSSNNGLDDDERSVCLDPVKANSRKNKKPQKKMRRLDMKKSEDVGQVESNALAKGRPFVFLQNYFLADVQRLTR
jgi:hypothetical protein